MADGDTTQYKYIKSLDVQEYWAIYLEWKKRIDIKLQYLKK